MLKSLGRSFKGGSAIVSDDATREAVIAAVSSGDTGTVMRYKQQGFSLGKLEDEKKSTLLHVAAVEGQAEMLQFLLQQPDMQKKVNAVDRAFRTALHIASAIGNEDIVKQLVSSKASLQAMDSCEWSPLHWAAFAEHAASCEILLGARADPQCTNGEGQTAIQLASTSDDPEVVAVFQRLVPSFEVCSNDQIAQELCAPNSRPATAGSAFDNFFDSVLEEGDDDWVAFQADDGRPYYWNRRSDTTTWEMPQDVAVNWYAFKDTDGEQYYWNATDETTTWELPELGDARISPSRQSSRPGTAEVAVFGNGYYGQKQVMQIDYAATAAALLDASAARAEARMVDADLTMQSFRSSQSGRGASIHLSYEDERPLLEQVQEQVVEKLRDAIEMGDPEILTSVIVHARSVGVTEDEIKRAEKILRRESLDPAAKVARENAEKRLQLAVAAGQVDELTVALAETIVDELTVALAEATAAGVEEDEVDPANELLEKLRRVSAIKETLRKAVDSKSTVDLRAALAMAAAAGLAEVDMHEARAELPLAEARDRARELLRVATTAEQLRMALQAATSAGLSDTEGDVVKAQALLDAEEAKENAIEALFKAAQVGTLQVLGAAISEGVRCGISEDQSCMKSARKAMENEQVRIHAEEQRRKAEQAKEVALATLREAVDAGVPAGLKSALEAARSAKVDASILASAEEALAKAEERQAAELELRGALHGRDLARLSAAVDRATQAKVAEDLIQEASVLLQELGSQSAARQRLTAAISAGAVDELRAALQTAESAGIKYDSLCIQAQDMIRVEEAKAAGRERLEVAIASGSIDALRAALDQAVSVGLGGADRFAAEKALKTEVARSEASSQLSAALHVNHGNDAEALRAAVNSAKSAGVSAAEVSAAERALREIESKEVAHEQLRSAMAHDDIEALSVAIAAAKEVGIGNEEIDVADSMLRNLKSREQERDLECRKQELQEKLLQARRERNVELLDALIQAARDLNLQLACLSQLPPPEIAAAEAVRDEERMHRSVRQALTDALAADDVKAMREALEQAHRASLPQPEWVAVDRRLRDIEQKNVAFQALVSAAEGRDVEALKAAIQVAETAGLNSADNSVSNEQRSALWAAEKALKREMRRQDGLKALEDAWNQGPDALRQAIAKAHADGVEYQDIQRAEDRVKKEEEKLQARTKLENAMRLREVGTLESAVAAAQGLELDRELKEATNLLVELKEQASAKQEALLQLQSAAHNRDLAKLRVAISEARKWDVQEVLVSHASELAKSLDERNAARTRLQRAIALNEATDLKDAINEAQKVALVDELSDDIQKARVLLQNEEDRVFRCVAARERLRRALVSFDPEECALAVADAQAAGLAEAEYMAHKVIVDKELEKAREQKRREEEIDKAVEEGDVSRLQKEILAAQHVLSAAGLAKATEQLRQLKNRLLAEDALKLAMHNFSIHNLESLRSALREATKIKNINPMILKEASEMIEREEAQVKEVKNELMEAITKKNPGDLKRAIAKAEEFYLNEDLLELFLSIVPEDLLERARDTFQKEEAKSLARTQLVEAMSSKDVARLRAALAAASGVLSDAELQITRSTVAALEAARPAAPPKPSTPTDKATLMREKMKNDIARMRAQQEQQGAAPYTVDNMIPSKAVVSGDTLLLGQARPGMMASPRPGANSQLSNAPKGPPPGPPPKPPPKGPPPGGKRGSGGTSATLVNSAAGMVRPTTADKDGIPGASLGRLDIRPGPPPKPPPTGKSKAQSAHSAQLSAWMKTVGQ